MTDSTPPPQPSPASDRPSRRQFLRSSSALAAGVGVAPFGFSRTEQHRDDVLKVGLIGCGGRGTGAASQALSTEGAVRLVAVADLFGDRLESSLANLKKNPKFGDRVEVTEANKFTGFDAYRQLLATDVDVVLLATPPHFRPDHFEAAIQAGKHVFFEKPVAVDGHGIQKVLSSAKIAKEKGLAVVCGLQRHHHASYQQAIERIHEGAIGNIVAGHVYWNQQGLWSKERQQDWTDMEWQLRNWLYFSWLSGDHIVEQHIHNLDVMNWAKQAHPIKAYGMGGRQTRTAPKYGHIFDHHAVAYEYDDGAMLFSYCRQMIGCAPKVSEHLIGSEGRADLGGKARIHGKNAWAFKGRAKNPYQVEHDRMFESIRSGQPRNEGQYVAESTLTAIMGRMSTYTGQVVTWQEALDSERLGPETYEFGSIEVPPVPTPGARRG